MWLFALLLFIAPADAQAVSLAMVVARDTETCLALNDYHEARGESTVGRIAVINVVLNRATNSKTLGVCDIIYARNAQGCAFSWVCNAVARVDEVALRESRNLVRLVMHTNIVLPDPSDGATFYHTKAVIPYWAAKQKRTVVIDDHIFYK